ncbi:MAG: LysM peptidoglycan-binding domain-containing protein [bacterium]
MRSFIKMLVILVVCMGMIAVHAEEKTWTYGGVEYRVPKSAEQLPADIPESHTVVTGDTLWGISRAFLNDPYLWPLIWEENLDTIKNPHRIYPGDIVRLPGGMLIATDTVPPRPARIEGYGEEPFEEGAEGSDELKKFKEKRRFSVITEADLISSGLISEQKLIGPEIIAAETTAFDLSSNDVIFVKDGSGVNLHAGEHYFIMREMHKVKHPVSGRNMGRMYHVVGEAEMLCVGEEVSSAMITKSYQAIVRGDFLVPWENIPMPMTTGSPPFDRCNPSTKTLPGHIIDAYIGIPDFSDAVIMAKGDVAYIDLGGRDGVAPGDYFTIFTRDSDDHRLPKYVSGELMVVKVMEETSVVVITQSNTPIFLGDTIELK